MNPLKLSYFNQVALFAILQALCTSFAADMSSAHQQGVSLAQGIPLPNPGNPGNVPGYAGADIPESRIRANDLDGVSAASSSVQNNEAGSFLVENSHTREKFNLNPHTDPLFKEANEIIANPQKALDEEIVEAEPVGGAQEETKVCEEAGEETLEECEEFRVVTVKEPDRLDKHRVTVTAVSNYSSGGVSGNVIKAEGTNNGYGSTTWANPFPAYLRDRVDHVERVAEFIYRGISCSFDAVIDINRMWMWGGMKDSYIWTSLMLSHFSFDSQQGTFFINTTNSQSPGYWTMGPATLSFDIFYKAMPSEEDVSESIDDNCQYLEEKVEKGLCSYEDVVVTEGPQTRVINDYAVTRDWWRRKKTYRCHYPAKNDCKALRAKGCYQVNSACKEKVKDVCVVWEQTYKCPAGKVSGKSWRSTNKSNPFCLGGDCADPSYAPNSDFANVMSQMSVLKEAGDDLRNCGVIFKGVDRRCTRHCIDFKDCCGTGNGWGVSFKLSSCDADEKELAELRVQKRCTQVGTYCAEKVLGVCIRKKTSFCCYDTKLAKIVQEQGKRQLGLGFGYPEQPQCQGLSIEQLAQLDFSRIDFSEIFSEIMGRTKAPNPEHLISGIQKSMADKGILLKAPAKGNGEGAITGPSIENIQAGQEPLVPPKLPGNAIQSDNIQENIQIQGRIHGQF